MLSSTVFLEHYTDNVRILKQVFPNHFCLGLLKLQILPAGAPNPSSIAGAEIGGSGADLADRGRDFIIVLYPHRTITNRGNCSVRILLSYKIAYYKILIIYSGGGFAGDDPKVFEAKIQVLVNFTWY